MTVCDGQCMHSRTFLLNLSGGWTLLAVYTPSSVPINLQKLSDWPDVYEQPGVFGERMFKGSLAIFTEAREEINSGKSMQKNVVCQ